jgi:exodeoxyribonuclease V gamma subunit
MQKDSDSNSLDIVYGNDVGLLADALVDKLFSVSTRPFESRLVVVPHISVKEFLLHRFFRHPRLKIVAGVQILPLNQAVMQILDAMPRRVRKRIPSFLELTLAIEEKLHVLSCSDKELLPLLEYLAGGDEEKKRKRIFALSDEIARCFTRYGLYGKQFLPEWLNRQGWQQVIWKGLFSDSSSWTFPLELLEKSKGVCFQGKIALFGFSYLPPAHLAFFSSLYHNLTGRAITATLYHLCPCALFWEDFTSDKERLFAYRFFQKRGGKEKVVEELDQYMRQSHPLLANWGKLGRQMLKSLDGFLLGEDEIYSQVQTGSLLGKLRQSILTLDESQELQADSCIQLHSATSKLCEVEVLRDALQTLLHTHYLSGDAIRPREILIACPDIFRYAPYIDMVFSQSDLSYAIEGMPLGLMSDAVQAFLQLIALAEENFTLSSMIHLLRCPSFMEKHRFSHDEVNQLCKWFKQAQIREGLKGNPNSWEEGIDRLLYGLAMRPEEEAGSSNAHNLIGRDIDIWPIDAVPLSEIDLFDRFLGFFTKLKDDLSLFSDQKTVSEWLEYFLGIASSYFLFEWEKEPFFQELRSLAFSCRSLQAKEWNFQSIWRVLLYLSQQPVGEMGSSKLEKIVFVPLCSGSIIEARIIWCLGMDEGSFPRDDVRSSVCEMSKSKNSDYYPPKADEDRFLFLEMLMKAKDYLIFSFQRVHPEDGKNQGPSLLVEELDHYLQKRGVSKGMIKTDHPAFPFDQTYFTKDASVKKWSEADFLAAQAHYFPHPCNLPFFMPRSVKLCEFQPHESSELDFRESACMQDALLRTRSRSMAKVQSEEIVIDIRKLKKLAANPLKFYLNEILGIYLKEKEDEEESEFLISYLRHSLLRTKALATPLSQVMRQFGSQGKLPRGIFQAAAKKKFEQELEDLFRELSGFGIRADEIFSVRFSLMCRNEPNDTQVDSTWVYRLPLSIPLADGRIAHIVGELENVTPRGLLAYREKSLKNLIKVWPLYLIYRCLSPDHRMLLFTQKAEQVEVSLGDPKAALAAYLEYYLLAEKRPSPLKPEWAKVVWAGCAEDFTATIAKESEDPYLKYLQRRKAVFDPKEVFSFWEAPLKKAFAPFIQGGGDAI